MTRKYRRRNSNSVRSIVKKMIAKREEPKRYSYAYAATSIGTSASPVENKVLTNIVAGTGSNQRVGHEIHTTGFYGQFVFKYNASASPTPQVIRILLVQPRCADDSLSADLCGVASVIDPDRYLVLYDRMQALVEDSNTQTMRITMKRKFNRKIRFDAGTGDPTGRSLQLYIVSDNNLNKPSMDGHWIIHYKE